MDQSGGTVPLLPQAPAGRTSSTRSQPPAPPEHRRPPPPTPAPARPSALLSRRKPFCSALVTPTDPRLESSAYCHSPSSPLCSDPGNSFSVLVPDLVSIGQPRGALWCFVFVFLRAMGSHGRIKGREVAGSGATRVHAGKPQEVREGCWEVSRSRAALCRRGGQKQRTSGEGPPLRRPFQGTEQQSPAGERDTGSVTWPAQLSWPLNRVSPAP